MTIKDKIKNRISELNPLAAARRRKMRKALTNREVSFFVPNCIGGILFHDLGIRFLSPTVNLMLTQTDFVKLVCNMEAYLASGLRFYKHEEYSCPCAYLGGDGLDDISIHFTHYATPEEAERKWNERKSRINRDNIFVFLEERDGLSKEDILSLADIRAKGLVVFTCNEYPDIPYTVYIPEYHAAGEIGNILARNYIDDSREYEKYFDFVKWFNEADGGNFDVGNFVKRI